jgi:MFS family permease
VAFSFSGARWLSLVCLAAAGFFLMVYTGASNIVTQTVVEEDKRGRVMSLFTMAFMGMAPLGSLLAGYLAAWAGPDNALRVGGIACLAGSAAFLLQLPRLRALVRPVYIRLGILPEMPAGVYPALAPPAAADGQAGSAVAEPAEPP